MQTKMKRTYTYFALISYLLTLYRSTYRNLYMGHVHTQSDYLQYCLACFTLIDVVWKWLVR